MQCTGHSGCFPQGKRAAIVRRFPGAPPTPLPVCKVLVFPYHRLLRQMDMGSLTCAQIRVRAVHTKGGQAQTSLRKGVDLEGQKKCSSPCPTRGSNPGSLDLNSSSLTTGPRPPFHVRSLYRPDRITTTEWSTEWIVHRRTVSSYTYVCCPQSYKRVIQFLTHERVKNINSCVYHIVHHGK